MLEKECAHCRRLLLLLEQCLWMLPMHHNFYLGTWICIGRSCQGTIWIDGRDCGILFQPINTSWIAMHMVIEKFLACGCLWLHILQYYWERIMNTLSFIPSFLLENSCYNLLSVLLLFFIWHIKWMCSSPSCNATFYMLVD